MAWRWSAREPAFGAARRQRLEVARHARVGGATVHPRIVRQPARRRHRADQALERGDALGIGPRMNAVDRLHCVVRVSPARRGEARIVAGQQPGAERVAEDAHLLGRELDAPARAVDHVERAARLEPDLGLHPPVAHDVLSILVGGALVAELDEEPQAVGELFAAERGGRTAFHERLDVVERQLSPARDTRADQPPRRHGRSRVERHVEDQRATELTGVERDEALRERARQHRKAEAREVVARPARQRLAQERRAVRDVVRRVGDRIEQPIAAGGARDVERLIEIERVRPVDGHERDRAEIFESAVVDAGLAEEARDLGADLLGERVAQTLGAREGAELVGDRSSRHQPIYRTRARARRDGRAYEALFTLGGCIEIAGTHVSRPSGANTSRPDAGSGSSFFVSWSFLR
jgi:hypothetical protein